MGNTRRKLVRMLIAAFVLCAVVGVYGFSCGKTATDLEWKTALPKRPRSPTEMRGILEDMLRARRVLPAPTFIPMSMWDDDVCAAAVVNAVNFIVGKEQLKVAPAWLFSRANAGALKLVFSRQADFTVQGERVVEKHDRPIWLSSKLSMVGKIPNRTAASLYIVGYLYRHTRSHELIVEAGGDLNSHLMLILGRQDGRWWGYHLLHDPEQSERNPFRIDDLGEEMPADFDLLYIWEVKGTQMPVEGERMVFTSRAPPYEMVLPYLGWGWNGSGEYVFDTALSWLHFGRSSQFPQVTKLPAMPALLELKPAWSKGPHRETLGFYRGIPVMRHGWNTGARTAYGEAYQCVELVNRFYAEVLGHRNLVRTGHADSYFYQAQAKGLQEFPNGGTEPPRVNDILVFDPPGKDDKHPGHVGIVYQVTDRQVCLVQQNMVPWYGCLPLQRRENAYQVGAINQDLPCLGWARKR